MGYAFDIDAGSSQETFFRTDTTFSPINLNIKGLATTKTDNSNAVNSKGQFDSYIPIVAGFLFLLGAFAITKTRKRKGGR